MKLAHVGIPVERLHLSAADNQPTRVHIVNEAIRQAEAVHGEFERTVDVGDAIWDVETTRSMELNFIGIRRNGDRHLLEKAGAGTVLDDYSNAANFMEAIFSAKPPNEI